MRMQAGDMRFLTHMRKKILSLGTKRDSVASHFSYDNTSWRLATMEKKKLKDMSRVLYRHQWDRIEDWVQSIDELADLSDHEIVDLERLAIRDCDPTSSSND